LPESAGFVAHAVDLLGRLGPVRARAMFGGHGIYCGGVMIGLVDDDEIFLKTDDACRQEFLDAGCEQWVYQSPRGPMPTQYFRPPDDAHEDAEAMLPWAGLAIAAARRAARDKAEKARARAERRKAAGGRKPRPRAGAKGSVSTGSGPGRSGPGSRSRRRP
jgi:DNA transformation protein